MHCLLCVDVASTYLPENNTIEEAVLANEGIEENEDIKTFTEKPEGTEHKLISICIYTTLG